MFAPTNTALTNLLTTVGQTSLDDIPDDVLRDILEYHVIAGQSLTSTNLSNGDVETVGGEDTTVSTTGGVRLNGIVSVMSADIAASGVVHVIDRTLIPPSKTIATIVSELRMLQRIKQFTQPLAVHILRENIPDQKIEEALRFVAKRIVKVSTTMKCCIPYNNFRFGLFFLRRLSLSGI